MAGERLETANLGWHGLDGDRRLAFKRVDNNSGFPWLTASELPELLRFTALRQGDATNGDLPTHVRTPEGKELPVFGAELAAEVGRRYGRPVEMIHLRGGVFDDAPLSVIASETVNRISELAACAPDARRFRPNVVIRLLNPGAFQESGWLGGELSFGEGLDAASITVALHDIRCSVINLDPDSARSTPEVLKSAVRANDNRAGIYGMVTRTGRVSVGQPVFLRLNDDR